MNGGWIDAFAVLSKRHEDRFDAAVAEAVDPCDAIVTSQDWLRVRVRDFHEDGSLLVALPGDLGQRCMVGPGLYVPPPERWPEFRDAIDLLNIRASVIAWVSMRLELRHLGVLDALRAALLRRGPTFGQTYPRIIVG